MLILESVTAGMVIMIIFGVTCGLVLYLLEREYQRVSREASE
jgi:hypothetical protein